MITSFRDIDQKILKEFKAKIAKENIKSGVALSQALAEWLERKKGVKKAENSFFDIKPWHFGKHTKNDVDRMDEILYGDLQ